MLNIASNADRIGTAKPKISKEQQELQEHMIHSQKIRDGPFWQQYSILATKIRYRTDATV